MAKETKFIQVHPDVVEATIKDWQMFGWEMIGAPQEIYNKDSHIEQRGERQYSVTETTHYVKITFQRDNKMPHYDELVDLEKRYNSLPCNIPQYEPEKPKKFSIGWIIFAILGICLYVIPGVIIIVYRLVTYPGKLENWQYEYDLWERRDEIRNEEISIISRVKELVQ